MKIRKFLVKIKPDGRVYVTEYVDSDLSDVKMMLGELMCRWGRQVDELMENNTPTARTLAYGLMSACDELKSICRKF